MRTLGLARLSIGLSLFAAPALSHAQAAAKSAGKLNHYGNPARVTPAPTKAAIDVRDLQIRLYQFADDSMMGRQVGRLGNKKGTDYIAAEVKRLGLLPAGDNGTYFQVLPYHLKKFTDHSRVTVDGNPLAWNVDVVAIPGARAPRAFANAEVIFGGTAGDTTSQISAAQAAGKFVVLLPAAGSRGAGGPQGPQAFGGPGGPGGGRGGQAPAPNRFADAAAVATIDLDNLTPAQRVALNEPTVASQGAGGRGGPPGGGRGGAAPAPVDSIALLKAQLAALQPQAALRITKAAAARLFARTTFDGVAVGAKGGVVNASLDYVDLPTDFGRNVVAIIPGSDPVLKNQYVAIGGHNDHVGMTAAPVDKDSLKAFNDQRIRWQIANNMAQPTIEVTSRFRVNMDSIRKLYPKPRLDSINNGADDDGSGSMGVLEIAEAIANMKVKPKRSTLFVWHTGEEAGLVGSAFFTANPTVPLDSVVAQINIDMIGRGRAEDIPGGSDDYVGVVGSFFDSKDLGETVKAVNAKQAKPLTLDYKFDNPIEWAGYNNIYGRSDHFNYAKAGVPIAFFFTGLHGDYHQRSDEPEYIDYPHYAKIANYIKDIVVEVSNGPRPQLNGTKPAKPKPIG
ncbi:MAG: M28 family peptidase [Gemmatimonadaceae bacterium]|nr:M28 family peptidase [Gemmatimonadaceae bacterium]